MSDQYDAARFRALADELDTNEEVQCGFHRPYVAALRAAAEMARENAALKRAADEMETSRWGAINAAGDKVWSDDFIAGHAFALQVYNEARR